ncbi:MAG: hypothetical protein WC876_08580 [Candidatus Thermoplasmatota archaeon]|jgi:hypothetical protein
MRALLILSIVPFLVAGCAGEADVAPGAIDDEAGAAVTPDAVHINDRLDLTMGLSSKTWTFDVGSDAKSAAIHFSVVPKADTPAAAGMPVCLRWSAAGMEDSAGNCVGGGGGNIIVSPMVVLVERTLFDSQTITPGHYEFTLDAEQSPTDFIASVDITY